mmetsp:Transcript_96297/g.294544  ORF Transcript_96297/g.294544 Transcript_96297/m.294544 type:complete len:256 (-) Transcript_96297:60-827(-)
MVLAPEARGPAPHGRHEEDDQGHEEPGREGERVPPTGAAWAAGARAAGCRKAEATGRGEHERPPPVPAEGRLPPRAPAGLRGRPRSRVLQDLGLRLRAPGPGRSARRRRPLRHPQLRGPRPRRRPSRDAVPQRRGPAVHRPGLCGRARRRLRRRLLLRRRHAYQGVVDRQVPPDHERRRRGRLGRGLDGRRPARPRHRRGPDRVRRHRHAAGRRRRRLHPRQSQRRGAHRQRQLLELRRERLEVLAHRENRRDVP